MTKEHKTSVRAKKLKNAFKPFQLLLLNFSLFFIFKATIMNQVLTKKLYKNFEI